jgi:hypothetical protein
MSAAKRNSDVAAKATTSWVCPVVAWASQVVFLALRGIPGLALVYLLIAVLQLVLIVAGLYLGVRVVSLGRSSIPASSWWSGVAGIVLSGGTILIIVAVALSSLI